MAFSYATHNPIKVTIAIVDAACAIVLVVLILVTSVKEISRESASESVRGNHLLDRPCDEIYVVGEGETIHTISDKCGDPFIVERNPHINDPDDVYPGLVIKITPSYKPGKLQCNRMYFNTLLCMDHYTKEMGEADDRVMIGNSRTRKELQANPPIAFSAIAIM
ncbi:hypothetical protein Vadar_012701 [Vaccinium darrowii]|uniref:Uncharacterized protein n=1 Tax=Vaccinium darrowii TaxID=229202 RepID=A0ACB7YMH7_9ERIC|nr:hypothetical protein Vadar_012701 [Vaccinium darrowii]